MGGRWLTEGQYGGGGNCNSLTVDHGPYTILVIVYILKIRCLCYNLILKRSCAMTVTRNERVIRNKVLDNI